MLRRHLVSLFVLAAAAAVGLFYCSSGVAQFEGLEGMEGPEDVSGVDCSMCHGEFAAEFQFIHQPAVDGDCVVCHLETGVGGHGGLVIEGRALCLECHSEQATHYPVLNCWAASCHADMHGSDVDPLLNPSRQEEYPGFFEATARAQYVGGSADCLGCHPQVHEAWLESMHAVSEYDDFTPVSRRGCESCHGPAGNHWGREAGIGIFEYAYAEEADQVCLVCHKDETFAPEYMRTTHAKAGVACVSCHNPHDADFKHNLRGNPNQVCLACHETKEIDFRKFSHHPVDLGDARTGLMCTDCHNPHGGEGRTMLSMELADLCSGCHVDKAGPFVYQMPAYDGSTGRGCLTCHSHHGANNPNLLQLRGRSVCLQCHTEQASHFAPQTCWTTGCHTQHHGSNANFFFFN